MKFLLDIIERPKNKIFKNIVLHYFQEAGIMWGTKMFSFVNGILLADDMGLGKTYQAIGIIFNSFYDSPDYISGRKLTVIITPRSVQEVWRKSFKEVDKKLNIQIFEHKSFVLNVYTDIILITYNKAVNHFEILNNLDIECLVLDEAHKIKNYLSKTSINIKRIKAKKRIAITATPFENDFHEFISVMEWVNNCKIDIKQLHKILKDIDKNYMFPTLMKYQFFMDTFSTFCFPFMLRREKVPELISLPKKIIRNIICKPKGFQVFALDSLICSMFIERKKKMCSVSNIPKLILCNTKPSLAIRKHSNTFNKGINKDYKSLSQNYNFDFYAKDEVTSKIEELLKIISNTPEKDKILIFTRSISTMLYVESLLKKHKINAITFNGAHSMKERENIINTFQEVKERDDAIKDFEAREEIKVLIISISCGGAGITLTRANYVIHLDGWWNMSVINQASDRSHRIGQEKPVHIYNLITDDAPQYDPSLIVRIALDCVGVTLSDNPTKYYSLLKGLLKKISNGRKIEITEQRRRRNKDLLFNLIMIGGYQHCMFSNKTITPRNQLDVSSSLFPSKKNLNSTSIKKGRAKNNYNIKHTTDDKGKGNARTTPSSNPIIRRHKDDPVFFTEDGRNVNDDE